MKVKVKDLKRFITTLYEDVSSNQVMLSSEQGIDSIDLQIDHLLSNYENESKSLKKEGKDFRMFTRRVLGGELLKRLLEADDESEKEQPDDSVSDDKLETPEKLSLNDIDVNAFADHVARMIDNFDNLIEVRDTLLRRAINYLAEKYDPIVVKQLKNSLEDRHSLFVGKSKRDVEDEQFKVPPGDRAGPGSTT